MAEYEYKIRSDPDSSFKYRVKVYVVKDGRSVEIAWSWTDTIRGAKRLARSRARRHLRAEKRSGSFTL